MIIQFRPAIEKDCDLLFKWVNDKEVRSSAFRNSIIEYNEHKKWFLSKINSHVTKIFIACRNKIEIGQIRIDIKERKGLIDYSVAKEWRGNGYSIELLSGIVGIVKQYELPVTELVGKVKYANIASQKAFIKVGYIENRKENFIEFVKLV